LSGFRVGRFALFIFLEIIDEPTNSNPAAPEFVSESNPYFISLISLSAGNLSSCPGFLSHGENGLCLDYRPSKGAKNHPIESCWPLLSNRKIIVNHHIAIGLTIRNQIRCATAGLETYTFFILDSGSWILAPEKLSYDY
jgi:hypothetical protein